MNWHEYTWNVDEIITKVNMKMGQNRPAKKNNTKKQKEKQNSNHLLRYTFYN